MIGGECSHVLAELFHPPVEKVTVVPLGSIQKLSGERQTNSKDRPHPVVLRLFPEAAFQAGLKPHPLFVTSVHLMPTLS